ncbi:MAG TPA: HAMP domain-containing protein [Nitrospirae bacterium]|nr:HAMP domain-containing protein [Nitrospirota bacterium]
MTRICLFYDETQGNQKKIIINATLLVTSSLTLLGLALSLTIFLNQKNQLMALQHEVVKSAVNEINWDIHEIENLLHVTSTDYNLLNLSEEGRFNALSGILTSKDIKHHNIIDELVLLDSKGVELERVSRSVVYSDSDLGERSSADEFLMPLRTGETYYGSITNDEITNESLITLSMPIYDIQSGTVNGVFLGRIRLSRIWENIADRSFVESGIVFITDQDGKVVAHPDASVIYRNTFYDTKTPDGIRSGLNNDKILIVSNKFHLGSQTFTVFAALPLSKVLALSLHTLSTTALFLLIFIAGSIVVSLFVVRRIVRPIESLSRTAREISSGNLSQRSDVTSDDELGMLAGSFNTMTSHLVETIKSLELNIADRKKAEKEIMRQNELMNNILNSLTHPFYVIDASDYTIKMANPAARFGVLNGKSTCYSLTHHRSEPCNSAEHPCVIKKIKRTGEPATVEHIHYDSEGNASITEIHGYPIFDRNGNIVQVIEYTFDITGRKTAEDKLITSLKEKEVLLREIHHRVKNNMRIISSLLRLQSKQISDKKDVEILKDMQTRIKSMALIHEKLYRSKDLTHVDLSEYIRELSQGIFLFYRIDTNAIVLKFETEQIWIGIDTAIPCGLIINELVSNSLKHAFSSTKPAGKPEGGPSTMPNELAGKHEPAGKKGEVKITLTRIGEHEIELIVSDNGIGLPEGLDFRNTGTLGLRLVSSLSEDQLSGKIDLDRTEGTEFRIRFKEIHYEKRI